jgi:hypothetical protein
MSLVYKARVKEREESFVWAMHVEDLAFLLNDTHSFSKKRRMTPIPRRT